ncbi:hypothetical protein M011DRAFT_481109 [Sporormia fimetaria CBS 119925]|uniref:Brl1/Brr6 domain-containing protein n=1 Tax=Sporormia fimetaria CBS 119925 TaxID=1340428 RepID=A0A6A6UYB3_9PLEO|nr:hypothetical protein M011DRAFT_481109 [Sporormia fimetaria CBS 119925]
MASPMDFEYENKTGPVDPNSPFLQLRNLKRPHSDLDPPHKRNANSFATPNVPRLRQPNSESFLFSAQSKPLSALPSHVQSQKWEPRTPKSDIDFSSGGETPNTPAQDSDAPTPETQIAASMGRLMNDAGESSSPRKPRRESWFKSSLKSVFSPSPSPAKESRRPYSTKAEQRVMKRRTKNRKVALQSGYDSDDMQVQASLATQHAGQDVAHLGYARQAGVFFSWIEAHPDLPAVLGSYFYFFVNTCMGIGFLFFIWWIWRALNADIAVEEHKHEAEIMREIALCFKQYTDNRCAPETRVPAMENACGNWESCMNRDPHKLAKGSVTARTFANIFNSFVETLSYKSMVWMSSFFLLYPLSLWAYSRRSIHVTHHTAPSPYPYQSMVVDEDEEDEESRRKRPRHGNSSAQILL